MILSSIVLFFAIFVLMASYCFVTVHGLEVKNLLTDGGKHMAQYPIGIFKKGVIFIFSFIISFFSFMIGIYLFNYGVKHYTSTGS